MSQPTRHDYEFAGDATDEAGEAVLTKAHNTIGFFVRGDNITSLDLTLQASVEGEVFAPFVYRAPEEEDVFGVTEASLNEDDAVYVSSNSYAIELVRPFVRNVEADSLEVFIFLSGQSQRGVQFGRDITLPDQDGS